MTRHSGLSNAKRRFEYDSDADRKWHPCPWGWHRLFFPHHAWRKWQPAGYFNVSDRSVYRQGGWVYATTRDRARDALREACSGEIIRYDYFAEKQGPIDARGMEA